MGYVSSFLGGILRFDKVCKFWAGYTSVAAAFSFFFFSYVCICRRVLKRWRVDGFFCSTFVGMSLESSE